MIIPIDLSSYDQQGCLHDMFVKQARKTPSKVAVVSYDGTRMTFAELDDITDLLARHLRQMGVGRNRAVGILMERCVEYVISYIAILKAGGAYLPIEMSYPSSLVESVLEDAQPVAVCTKKAYADRLNGSVPAINLHEAWLAELRAQRSHYYTSTTMESVNLDDMAYVVYSSGTTGKPKGILCPHRGAVFSYTWRHLAYPYEGDDEREACNIFFVWEMLRPLLKGIPMYIIPDTVIYDPIQLLAFLGKNQITRMLFTPSLLQTVLDTQRALDVVNGFKTMKQIWLCGEVVTTTLRNKIVSLLPWVKIPNLYSISECHDVSCSDLRENLDLEGRTYCPVGKLFPMVQAVILDENMNEKLPGDAGEIYIGGPTLAIGYLNRPDLNQERFVRAPSHLTRCPGERLYRTGDWGYVLSDGSLEVIGRCDSMVKIRGYTIELKAVENALLNIPEVTTACVLVVGPEGSDKTLVAYVVSNNGIRTKINYLRSELKNQLPFYMIPSQFVFLDKMPILDISGKTNKKELLQIEVRPFNENDIILEGDQWKNETARSIARIWCDVLKQCSVDIDDNFFDLGGHSLLAAVVVSRINERFGTTLRTLDLLLNPTIRALSKKVTTGADSSMEIVNLAQESKNYKVEQIPNIELRTFWSSIKLSPARFQHGSVLLTGAVGFVGSFLLHDFVTRSNAIIYCLVRSSTKQTAGERLLCTLKTQGLPADLLASRVILIAGDISLNKFGLEESEYRALSQNVDLVVHCAGYVNLALPYSAMRSSNVIGTHRIVSFCLEGKLKPLHHVSSNAVFPTDGGTYAENDDLFKFADKLDYGYGQTKLVAEQIVMAASRNGLPTIISRMGNVGGCRNTGIWNTNDINLLILQAVITSKTAPDTEWEIEFTPVDFVSKVIVDLTRDLTKRFDKIYHLMNPYRLPSKDVWNLLRCRGYEINVVPYHEWVRTINEMSTHPNTSQLKPLSHLLQDRLKTDAFLIDGNYHQDNLNEFLMSHNYAYPEVNAVTMDKYLQQLADQKYISPSERKASETIERLSTPRKGQVALVTGSSSGMGRGIAEALARSGTHTVGIARSMDALVELEKTLKAEHVNTFTPMKVDITSRKEVFDCVKRIEATLGPIDVLVNNAGVMEYCKMANGELDWWLKMVRVNCDGFLHTIAAVLPAMKERQSGHIVNITSDAARKPFANLAVYSGTKYFEEAVSEAMRQEIAAHGIKVSTIQPGDVKTGLHDKSLDQKTKEESAYQIEYLRVEDIAKTVLFVLNQPDNCAINTVLIEPKLGPI